MVEWKKLGDVCNVYDGTHQTPKYTDCGIKFVSVENIHAPYNSNKYISEDDYIKKYKTKPQQGDVLMTRIGDIGTCTVLNREEPIAYYVSLALLRPNQDLVQSNYVKYILESNTGKKELRKKTLLTAVPLKINLGDVGKISIPIPSLSEQSRIVSILDTFTSSISNLKQQIEERRKQYEYERDLLLDLEGKEGVEMKKLGEVCEIKGRIGFRGYTKEDQVAKGEGALTLTATNIVNQRIDFSNNTYITWEKYNESPEIMVNNGDIIICQRGSIGKIAIVENLRGEATINPQLLLLKNFSCNNKYLNYYLRSKWFQDKLKTIIGYGTIQMIAQKDLKNLSAPFINEEAQSRIVSILDTFEQSISNLEEQLAMREKQYEYYRNQLLTFEGEEERGKT